VNHGRTRKNLSSLHKLACAEGCAKASTDPLGSSLPFAELSHDPFGPPHDQNVRAVPFAVSSRASPRRFFAGDGRNQSRKDAVQRFAAASIARGVAKFRIAGAYKPSAKPALAWQA
jgi:hypothetical protein